MLANVTKDYVVTPICEITTIMRKAINYTIAHDFLDYLSNTDVTWGSHNTITLLHKDEFKKHLKEFLKYESDYKNVKFTPTWKLISEKIGSSKYVIIG